VRDPARVELYWLPLEAGDTSGCVRGNGRIFEAVVAHRQRRRPAGRRPGSRMVGRASRGGQGYTGTISYSSMRNHAPSAAAISFRQVMTPGADASQVKRSRGPVSRMDSKTRRSPSTRPRYTSA
jgi:hypothetical protein